MCDRRHPNGSTRAGAVVDDDRLPKLFGHLIEDGTRNRIGATPRWKGNDCPDGFGRP